MSNYPLNAGVFPDGGLGFETLDRPETNIPKTSQETTSLTSGAARRTPVWGRKNSDSQRCEQNIPVCMQPFVFALFSPGKNNVTLPFQCFRRTLLARSEPRTKRNREFRIDPCHAEIFDDNQTKTDC